MGACGRRRGSIVTATRRGIVTDRAPREPHDDRKRQWIYRLLAARVVLTVLGACGRHRGSIVTATRRGIVTDRALREPRDDRNQRKMI